MSKLFEALQKLERDSGKPLEGVLAEAHQILQNASSSQSSVPGLNGLDGSELSRIPVGEIDSLDGEPPAPELRYGLDQIAVQPVTVSPESRLVYYLDPDGPGADRFRLLRMRLLPAWESGKLKTIIVTSAHAQEGKSTIALNLATALAERGQKRVLVIETDFYHPTLSERLGIPSGPGLAECLESSQNPFSLMRRLDPLNWYLLPSGQPTGNPTELLHTKALSAVFDAVSAAFER
jgi:Mrp family chromosome partitioning ATPase